jgi:hypothetical protein
MRRRVAASFTCRPRLKEMHWFLAIMGLFVLMAGTAQFNRLLPASHWLEVTGLHVHDTAAGTSPKMRVDRVIHRPFQADWIVTVMRENWSGNGFSTFCTARGGNDYRPGAQLPDTLDLDWWTWPVRCDLPPGRYRVKTLWRLTLPENVVKDVRVTSNIFSVWRPD